MSGENPHTTREYVVRPAVDADRFELSNLIHQETYVHRHLDWHAPLDWIGQPPFLVAMAGRHIVGVLSCPMDLPGVAWIRLFAASQTVNLIHLWDLLWKHTQAYLFCTPGNIAAAIPLNPWMVGILEQGGFQHSNDVIILRWGSGTRMPEPQGNISIRKMCPDDLTAVYQVDSLAFQPMWQNSYASLEMALAQTAMATVAEGDNGIIGYQISTTGHMGGHIARLAVVPECQGRNIGYALVYDVLRQFERRMIFQVTVNTQRDNLVSQSLYKKAGFKLTPQAYQVYQTVISNA